jgi:hypothetical protein
MTFRDLISETDYAEQRGVSIRSVQRERAQRVGPPFIKVGRKVYYRPAAIEAWLMSMEQIQPRSSRAST